ncbi:MAG: phage holin family protein [Breznakibacter sp.]
MQDSLGDSFNQWKENLTEYVNARIELLKLETAENVAYFWANVVTKSVMLYFLLLALFFLSFALAFFLGKLFDSTSLGFLLTGLLFIVLTIAFYALRRQIVERPVIQSVLKLFFTQRRKK